MLLSMKWESWRRLDPSLSRVGGGGAGGGQSLGERGGSVVWKWPEQVREPPRVSRWVHRSSLRKHRWVVGRC